MDELRKRLVAIWDEFQQSVVDYMQFCSVAKKYWKYVSMPKVVTLNTYCDVASLTFQLSHITTGSFQSHQCLEERNITYSQMKKFCILQGSAVTFFSLVVRGNSLFSSEIT